MASIPPPHLWFPSGAGGGGVSSRHVITVASALRLGHLLHLRCSDHLHILLSPRFHIHSKDGCHSDNLKSITEIWCRSQYLLKKYFLSETLADAISGPWLSYFSFFNGKEPENRYHKMQRLPFGTSQGNYFRGRLWTNVILALNVLFYVAQVASQGKLTLWGAKVNSLIDKGQLWRLATSSFLHANIAHLMVNCYSLNSIGPTVEQLSGARRFVAVYFTSALASSLMSYRFCQSPAVGASGAIFGLVGSLAVFVVRHKKLLGGGKEDLQQIARVIVLNMVIGLLSRGIDNWGHLGGLVGGAAMSWFLGPAWKYKFQLDDGGSVFVDGAPIFHLIKRRLR